MIKIRNKFYYITKGLSIKVGNSATYSRRHNFWTYCKVCSFATARGKQLKRATGVVVIIVVEYFFSFAKFIRLSQNYKIHQFVFRTKIHLLRSFNHFTILVNIFFDFLLEFTTPFFRSLNIYLSSFKRYTIDFSINFSFVTVISIYVYRLKITGK